MGVNVKKDGGLVSAATFGAQGDSTTDDTVALQSFFNYVVANQTYGVIPPGTYKITDTIRIPSGANWHVSGGGFGNLTTIVQHTDNIPMLNMGYDKTKPCTMVMLTDLAFNYKNYQTSAYQNGNCIYFSDSYYECTFKRLRFSGWYGIKYEVGAVGPWGCVFDELVFTSACYGGAMDWTGMINAIPNNYFGRMMMDCKNMVGPVFKNIKGYNWTMNNLEFLQADQGAQLMSFQAGSQCTINAIKLENGTYTSQGDLILMATGCKIKIGQFHIGGTNMNINPSSNWFDIIETASGGNTGWLEVDSMIINLTTASGRIYAVNGKVGSIKIKYLELGTGVYLQNVSSASTCEIVSVDIWNTGRASADKGNADYTISLGDPNYINYETALTASRTVNLPSENQNLFNGLKYQIRSYGAVTGMNVIYIKCNNVLKATLSEDKAVIELTYKQNNVNAQNGWFVTGYQKLP